MSSKKRIVLTFVPVRLPSSPIAIDFTGLLLQLLEVVWQYRRDSKEPKMSAAGYTPALGHAGLTPAYDLMIRLVTRERRWRALLLRQLAPKPGETILDVGCGTGTFAILAKQATPGARIVGLDPDPEVLKRAKDKAERAGVDIEWRIGLASDAARYAGEFDKAVSSLVFHQVPVTEKSAGLAAMMTAVRTGGEIHIADYCRQPDWLMRQLFRSIQLLDGPVNTGANADGAIEELLAIHAGRPVAPRALVKTPTGAISLFRLKKR